MMILRLRPVLTREYIQQQGVLDASQLVDSAACKLQPQEHKQSSSTAAAEAAENGHSKAAASLSLRPCHRRVDAAPPVITLPASPASVPSPFQPQRVSTSSSSSSSFSSSVLSPSSAHSEPVAPSSLDSLPSPSVSRPAGGTRKHKAAESADSTPASSSSQPPHHRSSGSGSGGGGQAGHHSDDEGVSALPASHASSPYTQLLSHLAHILRRDSITRSAFAQQVRLSLSTVGRLLSSLPRVKRGEYGRLRIWAWQRDAAAVMAVEARGGARVNSMVGEEEYRQWRDFKLGLDRRQELDRLLMGSSLLQRGAGAAAGQQQQPADREEEKVADMELESEAAASQGMDVEDEQPDANGQADGQPEEEEAEPERADTAADWQHKRGGGGRAGKTSRAAASLSDTPTSAPSSPSSSSSSVSSSSSPSLPPSYALSSADDAANRLDWLTGQLHLSQKSVASLSQIPPPVLSQIVRRVYRPPAAAAPPSSSASSSSPLSLLLLFLHRLDSLLSSLVRPRLLLVHDADNLRFLSSLTVAGISRSALTAWLEGKSTNPMQDRQWIDEMAIREFSITQETIVREWERGAGAAGGGQAD